MPHPVFIFFFFIFGNLLLKVETNLSQDIITKNGRTYFVLHASLRYKYSYYVPTIHLSQLSSFLKFHPDQALVYRNYDVYLLMNTLLVEYLRGKELKSRLSEWNQSDMNSNLFHTLFAKCSSNQKPEWISKNTHTLLVYVKIEDQFRVSTIPFHPYNQNSGIFGYSIIHAVFGLDFDIIELIHYLQQLNHFN